MKILIVNKFLYPNGGAETYIFKLGEQFQNMGHEVQFFGMEHEKRIVGNHAESYTSNMDFHTGKLQKLLYPFKILYSREARRKIRAVLEDFQPDVVHLNNFNFQLTPSIIYEIKSFAKKQSRNIPIVYTAHDYQWVCPNHMLYIPHEDKICQSCLEGQFSNCAKKKCIHNSRVKSLLGSVEGYLYQRLKTYRHVDTIIAPSHFLAEQLANNVLLKDKIEVLHNFVENRYCPEVEKEEYILYFGRYVKEKGVQTLLEVCRRLPNISFVFAGGGPLEEEVNSVANVKNVGFQTGEALQHLIAKAQFSVFPSEWYENCPFSVIESQMYYTPVLGADIGGVPELIQRGKTGELFQSGNADDLKAKIEALWNDRNCLKAYTKNCETIDFDTLETYCHKVLEIYRKSFH